MTATLRRMCKYLKKYTFLGCYLRTWFCKHGFNVSLHYKNKKIKNHEFLRRWLVLHEHEIINFT